jgi:hypothetical protein
MAYFDAHKKYSKTGWQQAIGTMLVAGLLMGPAVAACASPSQTGRVSAPTNAVTTSTPSVMFGAYAKVRSTDAVATGVAAQDSVVRLENEIGRHLGLDHMYYNFDNKWPNTRSNWDKANGRIPFINWASASNGSNIQWSAIASGQYDTYIDARAVAARNYGSPLFIAFNHESDNDGGVSGTSADYVAAYNHIAARFDLAGATNVHFVLILMAQSYNNFTADQWYSSNAVDYVAADGYNYGGPLAIHGQNWRSFHDIFNNFYNFSLQVGKPAIISEFATTEDPNIPTRKADWITAAADQMKLWPNIQGAMWFSSNIRYPWWVDSSPNSTASFAAMGADPYFGRSTP